MAQHPLENESQSLPAGINHARLFQDGQQVGGFGNGKFGAFYGPFEQHAQIVGLWQRAFEFFGGFAGHGQNRAFNRALHGFVGHFDRLTHRGDKQRRVEFAPALHGLGEAAQKLRQDRAGIAPRSHDRAVGQFIRDHTHVRRVVVGDLFIGRAHGQQHIRAGIAIGHREDIKLVHRLMVLIQPGQPGSGQALEKRAVTGFYRTCTVICETGI